MKMRWLAAALLFAPGPAAAQDQLPAGRLEFRTASIEFRQDGTFTIETLMEGVGTLRFAGEWMAGSGETVFSAFEVASGHALLEQSGSTLDGCAAPGRYRHVVNGNRVRFAVIDDACAPRALVLDQSRWSPPGEANTVPPRTLVRTAFHQTVALPSAAPAEGSWPSFRGSEASGVADGQNLPDRWGGESREHILWQTPIPGLAHSSPIVWADRLFVTSAISSRGDATFKIGPYGGGDAADDRSRHRWMLYALDVATGRILWDATAHEGEPRDKRHVKSTYASATPATDGRVVVAWFGSQGLHAYTVDGQALWKVDMGRVNVGAFPVTIEWGPASSPVIWEDLVIVQMDTNDDSLIVALSLRTGEEVWKTERAEPSSWSTPTVLTHGGRAELVVNGTNYARGYDPRTGKERWRIARGSPIAIPAPVEADGLVVIASGGYGSARALIAIRPGASGELPTTPQPGDPSLAWDRSGRGPFMSTPLAYRGLLYVLAGNGVLDAYDVGSGEDVYRARVPNPGSGYSASPVAADGKIYLANEDGAIAVVEAGRAFRHIATNEMGEPVMATPALSRGVMFVRGMRSVFAVGRRTP